MRVTRSVFRPQYRRSVLNVHLCLSGARFGWTREIGLTGWGDGIHGRGKTRQNFTQSCADELMGRRPGWCSYEVATRADTQQKVFTPRRAAGGSPAGIPRKGETTRHRRGTLACHIRATCIRFIPAARAPRSHVKDTSERARVARTNVFIYYVVREFCMSTHEESDNIPGARLLSTTIVVSPIPGKTKHEV